jgi:phospholipid transport system substrate-binding protein
MRSILIIVVLVFNIYGIEVQSDIQKVESNFKIITKQIMGIVQFKNLDKDTRNMAIINTVTPMFDFRLMAKLSLGKRWKSIDKVKQKEFIDLYVNRMKYSYSAKIDKYTNERIIINSINQPKRTRIILDTSLVKSGNKIKIVYKYYKPRKRIKYKNLWLVYDIIIEGVSIIKTDKAQFRAILKENSIDNLMLKLQK